MFFMFKSISSMMNMNPKVDYYQLLDVSRDADLEQIKKAFMKKALLSHPDKAPADKVEEYTKNYEALQRAYKTLTNEASRKQYNDAVCNTFTELKTNRTADEMGYKVSNQFTKFNEKGEREFDKDTFNKTFQTTRSSQEQTMYEELHKQYDKKTPIRKTEVDQLMAERERMEKELLPEKIFTGEFDRNSFNRAFDHMKMVKTGGRTIQLYNESTGLYSLAGKGMAEIKENGDISDLEMLNGISLTNGGFCDGAEWLGDNPTSSSFDISQFMTGETYGAEQKMTQKEYQQRLQEREQDTQYLSALKGDQFKCDASEIETLYSELFDVNRDVVERLASKKTEAEAEEAETEEEEEEANT